MRPALAVAPLAQCFRIMRSDLRALPSGTVLIAHVLAVGAVLDEPLPMAVVAAPSELRVKTFDRLGLDATDREPADRRPDVLLDLSDVVSCNCSDFISLI